MLRPITVSPFPFEAIEKLVGRVSGILVTEMNSGQMLEDVRLAVKGRVPIEFYGRMGGVVPFPDEILAEIHRMASGPVELNGDPRRRWMDRALMLVEVLAIIGLVGVMFNGMNRLENPIMW